MKTVYFLMLLNAAFTNINAQNFDWAKREGLWAYDYGYGITNDNAGNVYVAGKYEMNSKFSGTTLGCVGNHDIYLVKYKPDGSLDWITTGGGTEGDYATSVACDNTSIYIAGEIEGWGVPIQFDNSPVTLMTQGFNDIFLAKYDMGGNLIWAKQAGSDENEKALGIAYDNSGNIYICGFYDDHTAFGATTVSGYGDKDIYIAKYDANGNFQWVRNAGSPGRDEAKSIKCDAAGNVYICGMYEDGCVFGTQTLSSANNFFDAFVAKYDPNGNLQWVKTAGGDVDDVAWGLAIDNAGKIYITGEYRAYAVFDVWPHHLQSTGDADVFVSCYDANGNFQWVKGAGGNLLDRARAIGTDGNTIFITGQFGSSVNFGVSTLNAADSSDIFTAAIDNTGNYLWGIAVGGAADSLELLGYESGNAVCADAGGVYSTGSLLDGGAFGATSYNEYDRTDVFVTKISYLGVGIAENSGIKDVQIYPNPSSGNFRIQNTEAKIQTVEMYNTIGEKVYSKIINDYSTAIHLEGKEGIYFIEMTFESVSGTERKTRKIIID